MGLLALGINHQTAALSVREKVAFSPEQIEEALQLACRDTVVDGLVILSTCNRTELIAHVDEPEASYQSVTQQLLAWMAGYHHMAMEELAPCHYSYHDQEALGHVMMVASGLNSMVLGEPQILGQMKSAVAVAQQAGVLNSGLSQVFQHTFNAAKRVRTETAIGENPVSVAFAAVSMSQHIFSSLAKTKALLIGAGETIELVARHLKEQRVEQIIVANRTLTRAKALAEQFSAEAILLSEIPDRLAEADIVISSTASQLPILGKGSVERALKVRKHRPIFMVDIAVPRDIEAEVAELSDVYLYTVDDLKDIIDDNLKARQNEAVKARHIIEQAVAKFFREQRSQGVVETLKAYRSQAEEMRDQELDKALKQLQNGARPEEVLSTLARGLTNKLIHTPCIQMKKAAADGRPEVVAWTQEMLGLSVSDDGENA